MTEPDPFRTSLLARPAAQRLLVAAGLAAALWAAIAWATMLP
jgi:hypothetical protein